MRLYTEVRSEIAKAQAQISDLVEATGISRNLFHARPTGSLRFPLSNSLQ